MWLQSKWSEFSGLFSQAMSITEKKKNLLGSTSEVHRLMVWKVHTNGKGTPKLRGLKQLITQCQLLIYNMGYEYRQ